MDLDERVERNLKAKMANNKQERAKIIEENVEHYKSELMCYIQQHVINAFMEVDEDDEFYIT